MQVHTYMFVHTFCPLHAEPFPLQKQLLSKLRGEVPQALATQRNRAAGICFDLAEYNNKLRKTDKVGLASA